MPATIFFSRSRGRDTAARELREANAGPFRSLRTAGVRSQGGDVFAMAWSVSFSPVPEIGEGTTVQCGLAPRAGIPMAMTRSLTDAWRRKDRGPAPASKKNPGEDELKD